MDIKLAKRILAEILAQGTEDFCICPGGRNAIITAILSRNPDRFRCTLFYDERSAAFFALGRIQSTRKPVAVMTTSGTAAGELLPAAMEAHYAGLPLILVTADRPKSFRGTGAPQAAEQAGLFGMYAHPSYDIEKEDALVISGWKQNHPIHINVCFEEPVFKGEYTQFHFEDPIVPAVVPSEHRPLDSYTEFLSRYRFPLAIIGSLLPKDRSSVLNFLSDLNIPSYFESVSGLRENPKAREIQIRRADGIWERAQKNDYPVDCLIRIGGLPTHRIWRDLEIKYPNLPVLSLSRQPFSGLARPSISLEGDLNSLQKTRRLSKSEPQPLIDADRIDHQKLIRLLEEEPESEPGMFFALSKLIPSDERVFLGNSLPIREWDLAASSIHPHSEMAASRGLNGIDGQVSTFLGFCAPHQRNWGIFGDLTALYDLSGPWILSQISKTQAIIVVINNQGGKIFERMLPLPELQNEHQLRFDSWAQLWGLDYQAVSDCHFIHFPTRNSILELRPNPGATERFWERYREL